MEILKQQTDYREEERKTYKEIVYWQENEIKLKDEKEMVPDLGVAL